MNIVSVGGVIKISKGKKVDFVSSHQALSNSRYIQIDDLRNDKNLKYTKSKGVQVTEDDVIIAWDGANAGTIGYGLKGVIGSTLAKLEITDKTIMPEYLGRFLQTKSAYLRQYSTGATIPHISRDVLTAIKIPVPSIDEQKIILDKLEQADSLRQNRKQAIDLLDEYLKSVFLEMFGDPVLNTKNWKTKNLDEIAEIVSGVTKGRKFKNSDTVYVPYMRVANVQDGQIDLTDVKKIEVLPSDVEKYRLLEGDVLLTEGGDPDKLGRGGVWKAEVKDCIHQNHIFRVRLNKTEAVPEFISIQIGSARGKKFFLKSAKQTTGIASINMTQLKGYPALIPPLSLQLKFSKIVEQTEEAKKKMMKQSEELDVLFQSLLQKSFRSN